MKLGRGWTQSPPYIVYHETSILIPLSADEVRFTEQLVLKHNFVCQRLVSFGRSWHTVRTFSGALLGLVDNVIFCDCRRYPAPSLAGDTLSAVSGRRSPTGAAPSGDLHLRTLW